MSKPDALAAYRRLYNEPSLMWDDCPEDGIPDLLVKVWKLRPASRTQQVRADLAAVLRHYADTLVA